MEGDLGLLRWFAGEMHGAVYLPKLLDEKRKQTLITPAKNRLVRDGITDGKKRRGCGGEHFRKHFPEDMFLYVIQKRIGARSVGLHYKNRFANVG